MGHVAYQYAEALYNLSDKNSHLEDLLNDYRSFSSAMDTEIYKFLNHPKISKKDKKEIILNSVKNDLLMRFIFVLIDNSRINLLDECLLEFIKIIDNQNKVMNVQVFSNSLLSDKQLEQLSANLEKKQNRKIILKNIVDEKIVGGLRIEYDGMILDETINNHLNKLKASLTR